MLISFDGTFIFAALSFVIFMFLMKYVMYKPLAKVIDERQEYFEKNDKTVVETNEKTKDVLENKEKEILKAKGEASNLIKETSDLANKKREEAVSKAKASAKDTLENTRILLNIQSKKAKEELRGEVENFVNAIASKVLEKEMHFHLEDSKIDTIVNAKGGQNA